MRFTWQFHTFYLDAYTRLDNILYVIVRFELGNLLEYVPPKRSVCRKQIYKYDDFKCLGVIQALDKTSKICIAWVFCEDDVYKTIILYSPYF